MFTDTIERYPNTAAMGPFMSCEQSLHIQSFMILFDKRAYALMRMVWRCPYPGEDKSEWVSNTEVVSKVDFILSSINMFDIENKI